MSAAPASLSRAEERALSALDEDELISDLVDLVRVPSVTGTAEESELQHRQAAALIELGADIDAWKFDLPALTAHPDFPGIEAERSEGYGVVASFGAPADAGAEMPALVLQGHVDVVPTGDLARWRNGDPYSAEITGEGSHRVLHGRGACDMKAGVAANLAVARALRTSGLRLERSLAVHTVVSEEDGGLGAFATMLRGHRGEAAVLTEPTSGRLVTANAGALTFELQVPGLAAHGSTRQEGINAIDAFLPVYRAIQALETRRNASVDPRFRENTLPYPISIGVLRAGDWASSVPDLLTAEGRFGVRLGEDPAQARAEFEQAVAEACAADSWLREHPARVAWTGGQFASGQLDGAHPLIGEVSGAVAAVSGRAPEQGAAPYGSDLRLYAGLGGIPTLHYGPGDVRLAHAPREQVPIAEVIDVARALLLLAVRRCGAHL